MKEERSQTIERIINKITEMLYEASRVDFLIEREDAFYNVKI